MNKIQRKRFLRLADYLQRLPARKFNFSIFAQQKTCGTVGCAMGWTPAVFPSLSEVSLLQNLGTSGRAEK